jgi:ADP-heptose:LPS heptosyltransferase
LHFEHGQLSPDSVTALHEGGIGTVPTHHSVVDHTETHTHEVGPKEYVKAHSEEFERIKRGEWLDNNTRRPDKNELRLDFRKSGNSIIGDIHRMYPGGSYTKNIHVDPQELIKHHKVSLQFCLSRDTQNWVMRIPVGVDGRVHIDPNSELGKTFFALDKDKMHYLFKYAEAVYQSGTKDGKPVYDMLATEVGPGKASHIIHSVETIYRSITNTKIDIPAQYHVDPPYIIPYFWRDPLEPTTVPPPEAPPQPYGPYEYGKPGEGEKRRVQVRTLSEMFPNDEYLIAAAGAITSGPNPIPNPSQIPTQQSAQQKNPSLSQGPNIPHYAPIIESHGETRPDNDLEERDGFTIVDKRSTATTEHQNKQTVPYQYGAGAVSQTMQEQLPNDDSISGAAKGVNQSQSFISSPDQEMNAKDAQIRGENRRLEEMIQYARSAFQNDPSPDNRMLLQNLLIERAAIGERFLPEQFYDKSPVVQGLDNAKEIIIVLKTAIGDAVLTSSLIDVAAQYCSLRNTGAKIIVKTAQREVIKGYEIRYPGMVKVEDFNQNETIESTDDRYIINGSSDRSPIIVGTDMNNPRRILNVDHYSFQMQEYGVPSTFPENQDKTDKHHYSFRRKIGTYPGMVARNFELLTGVKLFDDLEDQKFILPPPDGNETPTKTNELKGKYGIGVDEEYLLFAVQSSVRPKMLMPSKWAQVLTGLQSEIVDKNRKVVFIRPPDTAYATELDRELSLLPESLRNRIVWVREPLGAIADLTTGAKATISVDTGIGHISASLGTPTLMMYSSGNPLFWSAPNQPLRRLYTEHAGDMLRNNVDVYSKAWDHTDSYYTDDGVGLDAIPPERIIAKTLSMLEK